MTTAIHHWSEMSRSAQSGVTLLENMVTLLVVSVGLLGFAGMQAFTLQGSASSSYRQMAMQQAQDMADRIRANPAAFYGAAVNNYGSVTPNATPTAPVPDCRIARCTAIELAAHDIYEWQIANNALLPGNHSFAGGYVLGSPLLGPGNVPIPLGPAVGMPIRQRFTIALRWDGDKTGSTSVGAVPTDCSAVAVKDLRCYALVIDL